MAVYAVGAALSTSLLAALTMLEAPIWARALAILFGVAVAVALERAKYQKEVLDNTSANSALQAQEDRELSRRIAHLDYLFSTEWPPPKVSEVNRATIGVKVPFQDAKQESKDDENYVTRDIESVAKSKVNSLDALLIVGDPASGATRTAYEIAAATSPNYLILAPAADSGLEQAFIELEAHLLLEGTQRAVLWLDEIHRYTTPDDSIALVIKRLKNHFAHLRVIATVPSGLLFRTWASSYNHTRSLLGEPLVIPRPPSNTELEEARRKIPNYDCSGGIAVAFTAHRTLLDRMAEGNTHCQFEADNSGCSVSRNVLAVTSTWSQTGTNQELSVSILESILKGLPADGTIGMKHLQSAIDWATLPILGGLSLLTRDGPADNFRENTIALNAVLTPSIYSEQNAANVLVWKEAIQQAISLDDSESLGRIGFCAQERGLLELSETVWSKVSDLGDPAAKWLSLSVEACRESYRDSDLITLLQHQLRLVEREHGAMSVEVANILEDLGASWRELNHGNLTLELYQRSLMIRESVYSRNDPNTALTLSRLAEMWSTAGAYGTAIKLVRRARQIADDDPRIDILVRAEIICTTASVHIDSGRYPQGLAFATEANNLLVEHNNIPIATDEFSRIAAEIKHVLGYAYYKNAKYEESFSIQNELVKQLRKIVGAHRLLARELNCTGMSLYEMGRIDQAEPFYAESLAVSEALPGVTRDGASYLNLGNCKLYRGDAEGAYPYLIKAKNYFERAANADLALVYTLSSLAMAETHQKKYKSAQNHHKRAIKIAEKLFGSEHIEVGHMLVPAADNDLQFERRQRAKTRYLRALRIYQRSSIPIDHPRFVRLREAIRDSFPELIITSDGETMSTK
ncbi:tetratricopeptide repeat protein [Gordonia sp. PvP123]|uniref:tetratricopeptide repeat protein n=1 Tax=Gordonia sp. PvP123 TaxID=3156470 RepID=UPI00339139A6